MRVVLPLLVALLLAPTALAEARQVHLSLAPPGLAVTFESPTPLADPHVTYVGPNGTTSVPATLAGSARGDDDAVYSATIPLDATTYAVEGRTFGVHRPSSGKLRAIVLADMGHSNDTWALWDLAAALDPDLILIAGDISYANGRQAKWDEWLAHVEPLAARVPVMTALGNHETYCSPDGVQLVGCAKETNEYVEHFHMPAGRRLYYDFAMGPARFTVLDTEAYHDTVSDAPRSDKAEQTAFLRESLAQAGDAWSLVLFHRPLYSSNAHDDVQDLAARADWQPVLDAGGADLVLNGHAHAYERTYALRGDAVVSRGSAIKEGTGLTYVTTGGGGRSLYTDFVARPDWSALREPTFELVVLDITSDAIVGTTLAKDGATIDAFAVYRGAPPTLPTLQGSSARAAWVPTLAPLAAVAAVALVAVARRSPPAGLRAIVKACIQGPGPVTAARLTVVFALLTVGAFLLPTTVAADPSPSTYWFSRINSTHLDPRHMIVVVVPSAYVSKSAEIDQRDWIGTQALANEPGVLATVEATAYWNWMIRQSESQYPQLKQLTYTTKVLGVDATAADVQNAKIVVNTAMVADPAPFLFHLGLGLPTLPATVLADNVVRFNGQPGPGNDVCTVWNTGIGQETVDRSPVRLRNLVIHEFGHCLGAGHTGESVGLSHCNANNTCYDNHPTDVMSQVFGNARQCLSNLNVQSLAEGYAWATSATATWQPHDEETYMLKSAYATTCMPASMDRF